jgi:Bacterial type II and III secretion system protein
MIPRLAASRVRIGQSTTDVCFGWEAPYPDPGAYEAFKGIRARDAPDGQTIVIGGLRDQQREKGSSGVSVLSGIPIVGGLFGSSSRRSSSTELYLFLTPRILRTDADADSVTTPVLPEGDRQ